MVRVFVSCVTSEVTMSCELHSRWMMHCKSSSYNNSRRHRRHRPYQAWKKPWSCWAYQRQPHRDPHPNSRRHHHKCTCCSCCPRDNCENRDYDDSCNPYHSMSHRYGNWNDRGWRQSRCPIRTHNERSSWPVCCPRCRWRRPRREWLALRCWRGWPSWFELWFDVRWFEVEYLWLWYCVASFCSLLNMLHDIKGRPTVVDFFMSALQIPT
jgi:hypothetical protein